MTNLSIPEPAPIPNNSPGVHYLVIDDLDGSRFFRLIPHIEDRRQFGLEKYGTLLQVGNGRDALKDAFQEALDAIVYLKQAILDGGKNLDYSYYLACQLADSIREQITGG
jgi:hypothetical protein